MVTSDYTHIWDCCCDHGFLGASLLSRQAAQTIHFVDIVPELITTIENKLQQFYLNSLSDWKTHCIDVAKLPLKEYEGTHLIIIAGIGGDLMNQFINDIHRKHPNLTIDFLLCPVNNQFTVRQKLIALNVSLKNEVLIEDNRRFYEIILVSSTSDTDRKVSDVGDDIWQSNTTTKANIVKRYLEKTLNHYSRVQQGSTDCVDHIISAYRNKV
ncbi:SAM-dependent methyltransferase [Colwellia sp. 12G3]|nr:SAM-dependent methyltransferase [Colwellia sp. 12G3]